MTNISIQEYFAVAGSLYSNKDAQKIGPVLYELSKQGGVTSRDVVDAAKSTNSPLHEYFEWNDKVAADKWRLRTAGGMLASIKIRYEENGVKREARAFHIARTEGVYEKQPREYRSFDVLYGDSAFAASMMDSAIDDLMRWKSKYQPYTEMWVKFGDCFQAVVNQISEFEEEVKTDNTSAETDAALKSLFDWRDECAAVLTTWTACREQVKYIMEAITSAEETFSKLRARERDCMRCGKSFKSLSLGHRMCNSCSREGATIDEAYIGRIT